MIDAFPRRPTVRAGGTLALCVSTDAPAFRVELYRWGAELTQRGGTGWLEGRALAHHLPHHDWGQDNVGLAGEALPAWPAHEVELPADLPSGVYVAVLVEGDGHDLPPPPPSPDARSARALFVVRGLGPPACSILYKLPLFTYHAYNQVSPQHWTRAGGRGGWCLYSDFHDLPIEGLPAVSVQRPGGGTGATTFDAFNSDPFDARSPRQTFAHWDALAIAWLERRGYRLDFCTDLDLHADDAGVLLAPYRLLLSAGHDEYWSAPMRANLERFVAGGGNAAFLGGNTCWWRISFSGAAFHRAGHWFDTPDPGCPENALTGVSFRNGGERPAAMAGTPPVGFRVQHADHWVYAGAGVRDGDVFGAGRDEALVGYECDGAHFDRAELRGGMPVRPTGEDGTPSDFTILGVGDVGASGWGEGNRAATLGLHQPGGTVFTAATTDWARLLARRSRIVEQVTHNVLDRLSTRSAASTIR